MNVECETHIHISYEPQAEHVVGAMGASLNAMGAVKAARSAR